MCMCTYYHEVHDTVPVLYTLAENLPKKIIKWHKCFNSLDAKYTAQAHITIIICVTIRICCVVVLILNNIASAILICM